MKKRFWALFLAVMMVVSVLPTSVFAFNSASGRPGDTGTVRFEINNGTWNRAALLAAFGLTEATYARAEGLEITANAVIFETQWYTNGGRSGYVYECSRNHSNGSGGFMELFLINVLTEDAADFINPNHGYVVDDGTMHWEFGPNSEGLLNYDTDDANKEMAWFTKYDYDPVKKEYSNIHYCDASSNIEDCFAKETIYVLTLTKDRFFYTGEIENGTVKNDNDADGLEFLSESEPMTFTPEDGYEITEIEVVRNSTDTLDYTEYAGIDAYPLADDGSFVFPSEEARHDIHVVVTTSKQFTLTINYVDKNGTPLEKPYTDTLIAGEEYSVESPEIDNYTADKPVVEGNMPAKDHTIDVVYTADSYTLTINYVDEDGNTLYESHVATLDYGEEYSVASPEITGYTADQTVVSGTMGTSAVEVTVTYSKNSYSLTVHYVYEDGATAAADYTATVDYNESYSVSSPTITGYTADQTVVSGTMGTSAVEVTVTYTAIEYTITYELDGGTNGDNPDTYTYGVGVASFADATKDGYLFLGWYAEAKFVTEVTSIDAEATGDKTLYAKWEPENKDLGIDKVVTSITAPVVEGDVLPTAEEAKTTAKVGDTITWTITIENKGNVAQTVTLEDILPNAAGTVTVKDPKDPSGAEITKTTEIALGVDETKDFIATYVVQIADAGKELINKAVVTGENGSSEAFAPGVTVEPAVIIDKRVDKATAEVGDTLTYTISVTNNSSIALENVIVSDATLDKTEIIDILAVGETKTFTYTYKVQASDAGKTLTNTVIAKIGNDTVGDDSAETKVDPYIPTLTPVGPSKPALNYEDHINYIIGYEDGFVRPLNTITRAEVATIFFRLLDDESRENFWSKENPFPDVTIDMWCNNAISTMFNAGIITGYPDGTFGPYDSVSRAEFATIAARFSEVKDTDGETNFLDLSKSYWAYSYIELAEELGWVQGYQGYFRPEDDMTRAEVMTTVNRVLKRAVEEDGMLEDMIEWPDNLPTDWFYEDVQEATNSHTYYRTKKLVKEVGTYQPTYYYEKWSELIENPDWAALERAWSDANDK